MQLVAYRTTQEALTNVAKYASPSKVVIDLSDREGVLTSEIADDGCGISPEMRMKPKAFGLKGLQERARTVGGWLDISSQPGKGTCITRHQHMAPTLRYKGLQQTCTGINPAQIDRRVPVGAVLGVPSQMQQMGSTCLLHDNFQIARVQQIDL